MEHLLIRHIAEVHVLQAHVPFQLHILDAAIILGHLPSPGSDTTRFPSLQRAIRIVLGRHQGDLAFVHFRCLVDDLEDTLCASQGGEDVGHLHGDLVHGLRDLLGVGQIGHQTADVKAAQNGQSATESGSEGVANIGQVAGYRHDAGAEKAGVAGGHSEVLVQFIEGLLGLILMGEGFDYFQTLDGFLNVAVQGAQSGLLLGKVEAALAAQLLEHQKGDRQHDQGDQKEHSAQIEHHDHDAHEGEQGGDTLEDGLLQDLEDVVGIIGETAHQVAVGMLVKVGQGQSLHMVEQIPPQGIGAPLCHTNHHIALEEVAGGGKDVDGQQLQHLRPQAGQGGLTGGHCCGDVVDDGARDIGGAHAGQGGSDDAEKCHNEHDWVLSHVAQQTFHGLFGFLGLLEPADGATAVAVDLAIFSGSISHGRPLLSAGSDRFPDRSCSLPSAGRGCRCRPPCRHPK